MTFIQTVSNWITDNYSGNDISLAGKGLFRFITEEEARKQFSQDGESFWSLGYDNFVEDEFRGNSGEFDFEGYNRYMLNGNNTRSLPKPEETLEQKSDFAGFDIMADLSDRDAILAHSLIGRLDTEILKYMIKTESEDTTDLLELVDENDRDYAQNLLGKAEKARTIEETAKNITTYLDLIGNPINQEEVKEVDTLFKQAVEAHQKHDKVVIIRDINDYSQEVQSPEADSFLDMVTYLHEIKDIVANSNRPEIYDSLKPRIGAMMAPYVITLAKKDFAEQFDDYDNLERSIWKATRVLQKATWVLDRNETKKAALNNIYSEKLMSLSVDLLRMDEPNCNVVDQIVEVYDTVLNRAKKNDSGYELPNLVIQSENGNVKMSSNQAIYKTAIEAYLIQIDGVIDQENAGEIAKDKFINWSGERVEKLKNYLENARLTEDGIKHYVSQIQSVIDKRNQIVSSATYAIKSKHKELYGNYINAVHGEVDNDDGSVSSVEIDESSIEQALGQVVGFTQTYSTVLDLKPELMYQQCVDYATMVEEERTVQSKNTNYAIN